MIILGLDPALGTTGLGADPRRRQSPHPRRQRATQDRFIGRASGTARPTLAEPAFASVEEPQHENGLARELVSQEIISGPELANFAWCKLGQARSTPREPEKLLRNPNQLFFNSCRPLRIMGRNEVGEALNVT